MSVTKPLFTDETGKLIAGYLSVIAGSKLDPGIITLDDIHRIARSGKASDFFTPGDQIVTTYTATNGKQYEMPYDMTHFGDVILEDGETVPGIILQSHYATLEGIQFDAPEPDNLLGKENVKDNNVASYGYNRWSESGYRAWLNSNAEAGGWFGTTFEREGKSVTRREADVAPTQLNSVNGFMRGLPEEFLRILKKVKITTSTNTVTDDGVLDTTYDMFFLPSLENICVNPQATAGDEGGNWDYWAQRVGTTKRPTSQEFPRGITYAIENHTSAQYVRLRSAARGYSYLTWHVSTSGYAYFSHYANYSYRCAPACVIC
jgi:hypothetical protein